MVKVILRIARSLLSIGYISKAINDSFVMGSGPGDPSEPREVVPSMKRGTPV